MSSSLVDTELENKTIEHDKLAQELNDLKIVSKQMSGSQ
jgi:hypothetical protein